MNFFRPGAILCLAPLALASAVPAQTTAPLHLIPIPRELRPAAAQSLAAGVQISCAAPCAPEDAFAIEDLKTYLASLNVPVNTASPSTSSSPAMALPTPSPSTPTPSPPEPTRPTCPKP